MSEIEQLEQAIAALEAQRAILGDAVVDAMLAPAREKLAALQTRQAAVEQKRKQVTVLFADVSGFTALSETLDPEEVTEIMNGLWVQLDAAITGQGGQVDKHIGDAVMALWGAQVGREDDAERAIRAALAMQAVLAAFKEERGLRLAMRIGLNTGPVLLGEVGSTHEFTAIGDAVNLASRLEQAAPVGGILVSHDTYRQVRGIFDMEPQAPFAAKGKAEPVQSYVVLGVKPHAFHMRERGVEGVVTRMVGREAEMLALQGVYADALCGETRLALVVGDAGVGKSRLLYEFENWLDQRSDAICVFKGRAAPALQNVPYSLLRDLFAYRFDILETDSMATALEKFRAGMAEVLPPERADLVGHLVGFDFSASPAVRNLSGSPDFGKLARAYLIHYIRATAERRPVVMLLEDLNWADDASLDQVERLLEDLPAAHLLLVGLTRPVLFERRRHWAEGEFCVSRLDLKPLSRRASRELLDQILQKMDAVPDALRELVVEGAEGNPFYLEELVKMLIDDRVIVCQAETWSVDRERLNRTRIPPTLTGVLQARLDSLPRQEREILQRAAVVGRVFWDRAVAELAEMKPVEAGAVLEATRTRELVYWRERSAFAGTEEFLFKSALLRDAAYETVLLKLRKEYHARVAHWLQAHAGERPGEYAGLIAEHLERAGQAEEAARSLRSAAEKALSTGAYREALEMARRALGLLPEDSPERPALQVLAGRALYFTGDYAAAREQLENALAASQAAGEHSICVAALNTLGAIEHNQGNPARARAHLTSSLALAQDVADRAGIAYSLFQLAVIDHRQGAFEEARRKAAESRAMSEALGDRLGAARAINLLAMVANLGFRDRGLALSLYQQALARFEEIGARGQVAVVINNLGEVARAMGDCAQAQRYYREAAAASAEIGDRVGIAYAGMNSGHAAAGLGDDGEAGARYREALKLARELGLAPVQLECLAGLAGIMTRAGQADGALEILGLVADHPALWDDTRSLIEQILAALRSQCSPEQTDAGLARGKDLQLEALVARILSQD